jgi:sugar-specific transcriptional regulator TrmB
MADLNQREQADDDLGAALLSLLRFGLTRREQLVIRAVLLATTPPTAWNIAERTRVPYSHVKATVRNLIAWKSPDPDSGRPLFSA